MTLQEFLNEKNKYAEIAINDAAAIFPEAPGLTTSLDSIETLDEVVKMIRNLYQKKLVNDDVAWNNSVFYGTVLGEMIINEEGLEWGLNDEGIPVVETVEGIVLSPITKLNKIITSEIDDEGTPSTFYRGYQALKQLNAMTEEEKEKITTHIDRGNNGEAEEESSKEGKRGIIYVID